MCLLRKSLPEYGQMSVRWKTVMEREPSRRSVKLANQKQLVSLALQILIARADLARARAFRDDLAEIDVLLELGRLHIETRDLTTAEGRTLEARERAKRLADQFRMAQTDYQLGCVFMSRGELDRARAAFESAVRVAKVHGKHELFAAALLNRGFVEDELGRVEEAVASWEQAVSIAKRSGDTRHHIMALMNLGHVVYREHRYDDAARYWHQALEQSQRVGDRDHIATATFSLALAAHQLGRNDEARRLLAESRNLFRRIGRRDLQARSDDLLLSLEA
jgi:tetratricopeptide (TPR) repeat protein